MKLERKFANRLIYLSTIVLLCVFGLCVRKMNGISPDFFNTYFPDCAWTMAVYCGFGLVFNKSAGFNLSVSLAFSYAVEISQLFSTPFLKLARSTLLGGLIFGYGFLWSDIVCYTVGALLCFAVQLAIVRAKRKRGSCNE